MASRHLTVTLVLLLSAACLGPTPDRASWPSEGLTASSNAIRTDLDAMTSATKANGESGAFDETVGLRVGGLFASGFDTEMSLSSASGRGTSLRFEDELGLDDAADSVRADFYWRINRHHRIDLGYFDLDRRGTRTTSREIVWGDHTFAASTQLTSRLRTEIWPLRYTYYFLAEKDYELGAGIGIYGMSVAAALEGTATFGGATIPAQATAEFESPVPLPVIGIQGGYAISEKWLLQGSLQAFDVELDNVAGTDRIDGYLIDALLGIDYRLSDHFSIGAAGNWFLMNAGAERDGLALDFDYGFAGAFLFLAMRL
jgi:hypothetical protein